MSGHDILNMETMSATPCSRSTAEPAPVHPPALSAEGFSDVRESVR